MNVLKIEALREKIARDIEHLIPLELNAHNPRRMAIFRNLNAIGDEISGAVIAARTGAAAIERMRANAPDLTDEEIEQEIAAVRSERQRYGDWIETFTHRAAYPLDPRAEDVCIEDIAHALACENRYTGHTPYPYSVAQHSVLVAQQVAKRSPQDLSLVVRCALLHDAHEAYLKDIPKPVKPAMLYTSPVNGLNFSLAELERQWDSAIFQALRQTPPTPEQRALIKEADYALLVAEADVFFPHESRPQSWELAAAQVFHPLDLSEWSWRKAEEEFLKMWRAWGGK